MRPFLFSVAALVLGFSLGWLAHRPSGPGVIATLPIAPAVPASAAATPAGIPAAIPAPVAMDALAASLPNQHRARIETLKWLRESGVPVNFQVLTGDKFNEILGRLLGLNNTEMALLTRATQTANGRIEAARAATAISREAADGTSLAIEVPALDVATSGAIYDQLRADFQSTLGPEQLETFNELAGEFFERSFDRFGLNAVRYEISRPSRAPGNNQPVALRYKCDYVDATGSSTGSSTSQLRLGDIEKYDGLLAKILPPSFKVPPSQP